MHYRTTQCTVKHPHVLQHTTLMQPITVDSKPCYMPPNCVRLRASVCPVNHRHAVSIDVNDLAGFKLSHWEVNQLQGYLRKQGYNVHCVYIAHLPYLHTYMYDNQCGWIMGRLVRIDYLSESGKLYLEMLLNYATLFLATMKRYP